jgi:hypothetical protein
MNNLSWSGDSSEKKSQVKKEDPKKKKIDYKKEIEDLEKIYQRISAKYELHAHSKVSNAMIDIMGSLENLKKFE